MAKINFTKEHFDKLAVLANSALFNNEVVVTKFGQPLNIVELLHTTTIGTLNELRLSMGKAIEKLESQDEWAATDATQAKLEELKAKKELVNLIIGYKRFLLERDAALREKEAITNKINELEESKKTPDDKIAELNSKLKDIETYEDFK